MKQFIIVLLLLTISFITKAQTDTVCYRSTNSIYQVTNTPGNTYTWTIAAPGVITAGQGTNAITVNWGTANPGLISNAVSVFATSADGCPSPPVLLDVFVLNIVPTPNVAGVGTSTITYTYTQNGCTFTATGTATVNPLPTISPIRYN